MPALDFHRGALSFLAVYLPYYATNQGKTYLRQRSPYRIKTGIRYLSRDEAKLSPTSSVA